jgi:hypothetical protein
MKREWPILLALGLGSLGIRLPYAGVFPESWDAVDFALALQNYDLRAMQPHFPGYPFLILPAHFFQIFIENEYLSLSLVSVFAGAASTIIFYRIARLWLPAGWSLVAAFWLMLHPLVWLASEQPMSDSLGLAVELALLLLAGQSLRIPAGDLRHGLLLVSGAAVYAVLLGVRLSNWPLGVSLILPAVRLLVADRRVSRDPARWRFLMLAAALGFSLTLLWIWAVSLGEGGITAFFRLGQAFTEGHFEQWGNTAWAGTSEWERLRTWLIRGWYQSVAVGPAPGEPFFLHAVAGLTLLAALIGLRSLRGGRYGWFAALWGIPTTSWVYLGQNVDKPRHLLPLVPLFILGAVLGAFRLSRATCRKRWVAGALGFILTVQGWMGFSMVREHREETPPVLKLARYIQEHYEPAETAVFTWEEERVIRVTVPGIRAERLKSWSVFLDAVRGLAHKRHILLTGKVVDGFGPEKARLLPYLKQVTRFQGNPRLDPVYHDIRLYELERDGIHRLP